MPYAIRKLPNQNKWRVYNSATGKIHAEHTTKSKAIKQMRLLYMLEK